ncbi:hypothetical protein evm_000706 [Chilo suppressalis]|nr:hypothetical protein evm_000706 [Chilo suppressalis]
MLTCHQPRYVLQGHWDSRVEVAPVTSASADNTVCKTGKFAVAWERVAAPPDSDRWANPNHDQNLRNIKYSNGDVHNVLILTPGENENAVTDRISEDYYFGSASVLRTADEHEFCLEKMPSYICQLKCFKNHICLDGMCRCIDEGTLAVIPNSREDQFIKSNKFIDYTSRYATKDQERHKSNVQRPALRHHIAHFCPDLDVARECIKKCMKTGKPAFCGKDHVCYCGHKYSEHSKNTSQDAEAVYAQFKDMYEKYFGPNYKPK